MKDTTDISKIVTQPDIASIDTHPSVKKVKLLDPSRRTPLVYIPVEVRIEKPGSIALGIFLFLALSSCTFGNVFLMFMHQIILVK